jgi:hypothetical protein
MINLKEHSTIADSIILVYEGPGYYSGKSNKPLTEEIRLEKVAEEYMDKEDVYQFTKLNGYKVKPYKLSCCSEVPSHWEIVNPGELFEEEYLD